MTKKDYELIASAFYLVVLDSKEDELKTLRYLASVLATSLKNKNTKFDRHKFLEACGLK